MDKIMNPNMVQLNGRDTIVHSYVPQVALEQVDSVFNALQVKYRSVQAELNGMKKRIEDTIAQRSLAIDQEYDAAMREYNSKLIEVNAESDQYLREMEMKRKELLKEVQSLKIVIPNRLRDTYDALTGQK